jgi:hypothetical protein
MPVSDDATDQDGEALIQNAVDGIQCAVEDYAGGERKRVASAVRGLYTGAQLLLKAKLWRESPKDSPGLFVYRDFIPKKSPAGAALAHRGAMTATVTQVRERLEALGYGAKVPWNELATLGKIRNAVEHHVADTTPEQMVATLEAAFVVIQAACELLEMPPVNLLGSTWERMLEAKDLAAKVAASCLESRKAVTDVPEFIRDLFHGELSCYSCASRYLRADAGASFVNVEFECLACATVLTKDDVLPPVLERAFPDEPPRQYGDEPVRHFVTCPNCSTWAFHVESDECLVCGATRPHPNCLRCEAELPADEQDDELCDYCRHMFERAMEE